MRYPSYLNAFHSGRLHEVAYALEQRLAHCDICPRRCGVNRIRNYRGFCAAGARARVYSYQAHHGEEPPISGERGSGTIFFAGCNMSCVYCQNHAFSQTSAGREMDAASLAQAMIALQDQGCHNINLVTPTHVLPQILAALEHAIPQGLTLPLVYNTSGYELPETIALLDGIVDMYLPDMRYAHESMSIRYSQAPGYPALNQASVAEMYRQVGIRGLIIRHLVLPGSISGTPEIMRFIAEKLSPDVSVSLMSQYLPCHQAYHYPELSRRISEEEYFVAQQVLEDWGLHAGWTQDAHGLESLAGIHIKPI